MSFKDEIEFSLLAGQTRTFPEHVVKGKTRKEVDILKTAVIYGANASGKSNLIKAIDFAQSIVTKELKNVSTLQRWFRLDKLNSSKPSRFEFEFKAEGRMYAYGFEVRLLEKTFSSEWFYELGKSDDEAIFERTVLKGGVSSFSGIFKPKGKAGQRYELYKNDLLANQLFLHEINNRKTDDLIALEPFRVAYKWFVDNLLVLYPDSNYSSLDLIAKDTDALQAFRYFLIFFKTGISDVEGIELDFDEALRQVPDELKEKIQNDLSGDLTSAGEVAIISLGNKRFTFIRAEDGSIKANRLMTKHIMDNQNESVLFDVDEESDGTKRLFDFIPAFVRLSSENTTLLIDEIDRSLHPELTRKLFEIFFKNTASQDNQLIVTTHESSLLDLSLLRRDEVWFVEKNKLGESKLYSLEEYNPRHDKEIRKAYLLGRYGAIPFIANVEELGWNRN